MNVPRDHQSQRWESPIRVKAARVASVLSICGPSGVGKTTVVKALVAEYPAFVETTEGNPHLRDLLRGSSHFNAAGNQRWFLERVGKHIIRSNPKLPLILDQDPAAIVLAYARMFFEDGKITEMQYTSLLKRLLKMEEELRRWKYPRLVLFLDAPANLLHQRILRRSGKSLTPPIEWFERVRNNFLRLFTHFPNAFKISTEKCSPEQVTTHAREWIEKESKMIRRD